MIYSGETLKTQINFQEYHTAIKDVKENKEEDNV